MSLLYKNVVNYLSYPYEILFNVMLALSRSLFTPGKIRDYGYPILTFAIISDSPIIDG